MSAAAVVKPPTATLEEILVEVADLKLGFGEQRYVSRAFVERLKETGLYRATTPARFGGDALPPAQFLDVIEQISKVDGSTGWVASFAVSGMYLAALPLETQAQIYCKGPDLAFTGAVFPVQSAAVTPGGYVVDGRWKYASGCMGAELLGVGIVGDSEHDAAPRVAVLPPERVEIVKEWDVVGMRGTGSFDLVVRDVEVAREWTFVRGSDATVDEPLYRYPTITYAAQVLAVTGAGVARAALDHALAVGSGYTGVTAAPRLADRAYYRTGVAGAEAQLRSARAWFYEATTVAWDSIMAGDPMTDAQNAHVRLAAAHLARTASDVVSGLVLLSGTAAINTHHPLQRLLGDAMVPKQHAFLGPAIDDAAGAVLMGLPATSPGFH